MAKDPESVNAASQIEETPNPQISEEPQGQPLSQAGEEPVTLEDVKRMIQSEKDVRFGKYGTRLDNLEDALSTYENLQKSGMTKEQAAQQMQGDRRLQDLESEIKSLKGEDASVTSVGTGVEPWGVRQAKLLESAGLSKTDSRAVKLAQSRESWTKQEWLDALEEKTFEWRNADLNKPQPSSSTVASTVPSVTPGVGEFDDYSDDQLGEKLIELFKNPSKNQAEMDILDAELKRRDAKK